MTWLLLGAVAYVWFVYGWMFGVATLVIGWLLLSWFFPMTDCWWCKGKPRNYARRGKNWNKWCPMCDSSGHYQRIGSRLLHGGFGKIK